MTATLLLLAAGSSSRMKGRDKLLEDMGGEPLLRLMARRATKAGVPVRVVLGPAQDARRAALDGLAVEIVEATGTDGMAASIRAGVAGLAGPVLVALADMPEITAQDLYLMLSLGAQSPGTILRAATQDGRPGNPVLFPADLVPELAQLTGDAGARDILKREAARVALLPLQGDRAAVDLDTPEDWAAWRARRGG
ncbi:nucleotidyltransferase family protein [Roseicyclus persicicus]|uniref:Nucleotidyltransferase family protein n=1 Tax=Roseicyclus persicicus TaxID=2650661 RepID=A0A7X6H1V4_9RHOB|nr:nucleotidyltransferase family protein [Roseibacterium persicicum]NKX46488.1 nucleotidyltransferase family protein [Roseibacterium persicicum]